MKKIEIFIGSPRKKGNTFILSNLLTDELDQSKFISKTSFLYDYEIKPCIDCRFCKKDNLICALKDGMKDLYTKIEESDVLIFGTPIYWYGPTAKMKLLIDRLRPYYANKKLIGKKAALLVPAAMGEQDCDVTIEMFKRIFAALGIENLGAVTATAYEIGEVKQDVTALRAISDLANALKSLPDSIK